MSLGAMHVVDKESFEEAKGREVAEDKKLRFKSDVQTAVVEHFFAEDGKTGDNVWDGWFPAFAEKFNDLYAESGGDSSKLKIEDLAEKIAGNMGLKKKRPFPSELQ